MFSYLCCIKNWVRDLERRVFILESSQSAQAVTYVTVWAEKNGALNIGQAEYSFGNGNAQSALGTLNDWGYVTHFDYEIISATIGLRLTNTADTAIQVVVNDAAVGPVVTVPGGQTKVVDNAISYSGVAGDTLNFVTVLNGGGDDVVPSIMIRYTLP